MLDRPNDSLSARDIAYHMHPFTNARRLESEGPFVITRGDGIRIFDEQGRDYIDALAGLWCASLGFSEKRLAEAAYKQMLELPYASTFGQRSHPTVIELAEKLISLMPVPMSKVIFNNSGSEANDTAAKLVWYYNNAIGRPRKKKIIGRMKGYHGITVGRRQPVRPALSCTRTSTCRSPTSATPTARISGATASPARARRISPRAWPRTSMR